MHDPVTPKPLASHSANYTNFALTKEGRSWIYRPTRWTLLFIKIVKFFGYSALFSSVFALTSNFLAFLFVLAAGAAFVYLANFVARQYDNGARFDTVRRIATVLREPLFNQSLKMFDTTTENVPFDRIDALQILHKYARMTGHPARFVSYELNLVLKNGKRFNIVDHSDVEQIRRDARLLSDLLNVSVQECPLK